MAKSKKNAAKMQRTFAREGGLAALRDQNVINSRARNKGFDILCRGPLFDAPFTVEVGDDGQPQASDLARIEAQIKAILGTNFAPRPRAGAKNDSKELEWASAVWSNKGEAAQAQLNPNEAFELGLCVPRKFNPERALRVAALIQCRASFQGLSLTPNGEGKHLNVPGMGVCLARDHVLITRGGREVALASLMDVLLKKRVTQWAKALPEERAERAERAAAEKKAAERRADAALAASMFRRAAAQRQREIDEAVRLDQERREAERQAQLAAEWAEVTTTRPDLVGAWEQARTPLNESWAVAQDDVRMAQGLARPGLPAESAVSDFVSLYPEHLEAMTNWCESTYIERLELGESHPEDALERCVLVLKRSSTLVNEWFDESGRAVEALKPLEEYTTREQWLTALSRFPGVEQALIARFKEM